MTLRLALVSLALLTQTGCVAAIPMATQMMSGGGSPSQLCSLMKIPGQAASLCERLPGMAAHAPDKTADAHQTQNGTNVDTASR